MNIKYKAKMVKLWESVEDGSITINQGSELFDMWFQEHYVDIVKDYTIHNNGEHDNEQELEEFAFSQWVENELNADTIEAYIKDIKKLRWEEKLEQVRQDMWYVGI